MKIVDHFDKFNREFYQNKCYNLLNLLLYDHLQQTIRLLLYYATISNTIQLTMDVHRAVVDFTPPPGSGRVLSLLLGEFIEVLEPETTRQHREWWGVRRLYDEELGYVPAKYLEVNNRKLDWLALQPPPLEVLIWYCSNLTIGWNFWVPCSL